MNNTVLFFENKHEELLPEEFRDDDNRFTEDFVQFVLEQYTKPGDIVFDPFAGYATTLIVCEKQNRVGYGIEVDRVKYEYGLTRLKRNDLLILGDSINLSKYNLPALDLILFSPPYMNRFYDRNPIRRELKQDNCYSNYLQDLLSIATSAWQLLKPGKHLIVEAANLVSDLGLTTLAWDIAALFREKFPFIQEKVLHWGGGYGAGYDHSYCLIFRKRDT
jgi:DNA modification methylase